MIDIDKLSNQITENIDEILDITLEVIKKAYLEADLKGWEYKLIANETSWDFYGPMPEEITPKEVQMDKAIELLSINASIRNNFLITLEDFNLHINDAEYKALYNKYKDECIIANNLNHDTNDIDIAILRKFIKNFPDLHRKIIIDNIEMDWSVYRKEEIKKEIEDIISEL